MLKKWFFFFVCLFVEVYSETFSVKEIDCSGFSSVAIVQLSFDGVNSLNCGVGTVVVETSKVIEELNRKKIPFKNYLICPNYSNDLSEYSFQTLSQNILRCSQTGGRVFLVPKEVCHQFFGDPVCWKKICLEAAEVCAQIINENPFTIVIAHDTVFAHVPINLFKLRNEGALLNPYKAIWVPHATSWSYNGHENGKANWPERHEWELEAFEAAKKNYYPVGFIGSSFKKHIQEAPFYMQDSQLTPFRTGILLDRFLEERPYKVIEKELHRRGIPIDRPLLFSIGRATPIKGQDIILEAFRKLKESFPALHLVLQAPFSDQSPEFGKLLKERIQKENLDVTLIDDFDVDLSSYVYQWPNTYITALLSREDTQPLTVMEARVNPKNSIVLVSNRGGMGAQVRDGKDGFVCNIDGIPEIIQEPLEDPSLINSVVFKMEKILSLTEKERHAVIEEGKKLIKESYNLRKEMRSNISSFLKDFCEEISFDQDSFPKKYGLPTPLFFKSLHRGMCNPPILVSSECKGDIGVVKKSTGDKKSSILRLELLRSMKERGLDCLPYIHRNADGSMLSLIGDEYYYFMEYLAPDPLQKISCEEMLSSVGEFHRLSSSDCPGISHRKIDEFLQRSFIFEEQKSLFSERFLSVFQYFCSDAFVKIYNSLPHRFIHGDCNFSNVVISDRKPYFIDLDASRVDVRLLDLASLFRYGFFDQYLYEKNLMDLIHFHYGLKAGELSSLEEEHFHELVLFSHVEFLSFALCMKKQAVIDCDELKISLYSDLIDLYKSQIEKTLEKKDLGFYIPKQSEESDTKCDQ